MTDPGRVAIHRNLIPMSDGVELAGDLTTLTTTHEVSNTATITVDGSPFWTRAWRRLGRAAANP